MVVLHGNGLVYHSAPFTRATEISGWIRFVAWIALDVPDTDFLVSVSEVLTNGNAISLTQDLLRARYRESLREESARDARVAHVTLYHDREHQSFQEFPVGR